jgi:hypothetical protein
LSRLVAVDEIGGIGDSFLFASDRIPMSRVVKKRRKKMSKHKAKKLRRRMKHKK